MLSPTLMTVAIAAALIGALAGVLGSFLVLRGQSLLGDVIAHAALPGVVRQRLGGLRRRHLAVAWTEGAALMVGALVVLIAVQLLGDWFLDLPLPVRAILLVADVVALGWLVWRGLVRPWRQRLTSATAALRAEKTFPSLRGSLISAVQLSQGTDTGTVSPGLLSAVVTRAAASVQPLKFAQIIPAARAGRLALGCVALLAAALAVIALDSARSGPLLRRFALSNEPLPTRTRALVSAAPRPDQEGGRSRHRIMLAGDPPSPLNPPAGCPFHPRCAYATEPCKTTVPALDPHAGRDVACLRVGEI